MSIRDIVENEKESGRFPRIAKLRKGDPKRIHPKTGKEIVGRNQEHFRITFEPEFEYLMDTWVELYGEKPMEFSPVVLDVKTVDEALDFWYEDYDSSETLLHRCDGKFQHLWYDRERGGWNKAQIACAVSGTGCSCRPKGRMNLLFPEFIVATGVIGYIAAETGSLEDIRTLRDRLRAIQNAYGTLHNVHLTFGRTKRKVNRPEVKNGERTGKRMKTTESMLYLLPTPEFTKKVLLPVLTGEVKRAGEVQPQLLEPQTGTEKPSLPATLGNGGGVRRLGGKPQTDGHTESIYGDAESWGKFVEWAQSTFNMDEGMLLDALDMAVDYAVELATDWREDQSTATAAAIAYMCNYSMTRINTYFEGRNFSPQAQEQARAIAHRVAEEAVEEVES